MEAQPIIKVRDVAFPRLSAPDLDVMEAFLLDFGLVRAERTADALYMRGLGPDRHVHVVHKGEPGFLVFRSLTKTWALAGLRAGYALGAPDVLARLAAPRPPWPV